MKLYNYLVTQVGPANGLNCRPIEAANRRQQHATVTSVAEKLQAMNEQAELECAQMRQDRIEEQRQRIEKARKRRDRA